MEKGQKTGVLIVEDSRIATNMLKSVIEESERYELIDAIENAANAELACLSGRINLVSKETNSGLPRGGSHISTRMPKRSATFLTFEPTCPQPTSQWTVECTPIRY